MLLWIVLCIPLMGHWIRLSTRPLKTLDCARAVLCFSADFALPDVSTGCARAGFCCVLDCVPLKVLCWSYVVVPQIRLLKKMRRHGQIVVMGACPPQEGYCYQALWSLLRKLLSFTPLTLGPITPGVVTQMQSDGSGCYPLCPISPGVDTWMQSDG